MDLLDDMGVSKLSAKVFFKTELLLEQWTDMHVTKIKLNPLKNRVC